MMRTVRLDLPSVINENWSNCWLVWISNILELVSACLWKTRNSFSFRAPFEELKQTECKLSEPTNTGGSRARFCQSLISVLRLHPGLCFLFFLCYYDCWRAVYCRRGVVAGVADMVYSEHKPSALSADVVVFTGSPVHSPVALRLLINSKLSLFSPDLSVVAVLLTLANFLLFLFLFFFWEGGGGCCLLTLNCGS